MLTTSPELKADARHALIAGSCALSGTMGRLLPRRVMPGGGPSRSPDIGQTRVVLIEDDPAARAA